MSDVDDARAALQHLVKKIEGTEGDIGNMEQSVTQHNRVMIRDGAQLRTEIKTLREQIESLRGQMEIYKKNLLSFVAQFKQVVHKEQIENLNKHMDGLNFERALLRSQVKDMVEREFRTQK